jgi:hypothetical protein
MKFFARCTCLTPSLAYCSPSQSGGYDFCHRKMSCRDALTLLTFTPQGK